jgi:hypothetical protein
MYDVIGDIHGYHDLLVRLLTKMGYQKRGKSFFHHDRKAVFVGDFINRGSGIKETVRLVRRMVEQGSALAVLGNHEFNAILYSTLDKSGKLLRKQLPRYKMPLMKTLYEYEDFKSEWVDTVKWFRTLPVYLDLGGIRVVHGGWNDDHIHTFEQYNNGETKLRKKFLKEFLINPGLNKALNELIKGVELELPRDLILRDSNGLSHRRFRIKWWEQTEGKTFRDVSFGNRFQLPSYTIPKEISPIIVPYPDDAPPVFLGHYCLDRTELMIKHNIFCVDQCVARNHKLVAYRWQGETWLTEDHVVEVKL